MGDAGISQWGSGWLRLGAGTLEVLKRQAPPPLFPPRPQSSECARGSRTLGLGGSPARPSYFLYIFLFINFFICERSLGYRRRPEGAVSALRAEHITAPPPLGTAVLSVRYGSKVDSTPGRRRDSRKRSPQRLT